MRCRKERPRRSPRSSALRDAAINGAASFVEGATTELLDQWFGAGLEE
jgi:hypothetical protein